MQEETSILHNVLTQLSRYQEDKNLHAGQRWKLPPNGQPITLFSGIPGAVKTVIRPDDDSKLTIIKPHVKVPADKSLLLLIFQLYFESIVPTTHIARFVLQFVQRQNK